MDACYLNVYIIPESRTHTTTRKLNNFEEFGSCFCRYFNLGKVHVNSISTSYMNNICHMFKKVFYNEFQARLNGLRHLLQRRMHFLSQTSDEVVSDNFVLLVVPQYARNPNETGNQIINLICLQLSKCYASKSLHFGYKVMWYLKMTFRIILSIRNTNLISVMLMGMGY